MIAWAKGNASDLRWAVAIFVVAFVLRLLYVLWNNADPSTSAHTDAWFYHHSAEAMRIGRGYIFPGHLKQGPINSVYGGAPTAWWPPGYTAVLAAVYILPGPDIIMGKLLNVLLGSLTCSMVFALGRLMWSRAVGVVAGLILTFFPSHVFFSTMLLTETVFATLVTLILLLFIWAMRAGRTDRVLLMAGLGLIVGATSLVRGEGLLLPVVLAACLWLTTGSFRHAARFALWLFLGASVILGGWTVRNVIQIGAPIPINTGSSHVLSLAHWKGANGGGNRLRSAQVLAYDEDLPWPDREVHASERRTRDALKYWATHPSHEAELVPRRLFELYRHDHDTIDWLPPDNHPLGSTTLNRLRVLSDFYFFAALGVSMAGAVLWWKAHRASAVLLLGLVAYVSALMGLVFFGDQRYHAMLVPVFALLAAPALLRASQALGDGELG